MPGTSISYLRHPLYVWGDGSNIHIWRCEPDPAYDAYLADCDCPGGLAIPNDIWDALCLMRVAEIDAAHNRRTYEKRALKFGGNYGSAALYERLGLTPPWQKPES